MCKHWVVRRRFQEVGSIWILKRDEGEPLSPQTELLFHKNNMKQLQLSASVSIRFFMLIGAISVCIFGSSPTCPVAGVVEVNRKGAWLVLSLPRWGWAVLVVCVGVVVMDVLSRQHGRPWWAAHGRGDESIDEVHAAIFHYFTRFVHHLQRACKTSWADQWSTFKVFF